jgi:hypothetical protein
MISRPTMNFCRLPPESEAAAELAAAFDLEAFDHLLRKRAHGAALDQAMPHHAGAGCRQVAGQQRVIGQRQVGRRAAPQPLLGHEAKPQLAALRRIERADVVAERSVPSAPSVRSPEMAFSSSCWPLPEMPAMPTISPLRSDRQISLSRVPNGSSLRR